MVRHGLKHIFQKPCPDLSSSERTQQLRSKTVYSGTVDLAKTISGGGNNRYKTYNGPYEVVDENGNYTLVASQSYDDLLSITKGKVLLNQLPLNSSTQSYYQKNFANGEMYVGVFNQFDPSFNFVGHTGCNNSVMVYDISANGFTGSYDASGGFIGITGPSDTAPNNRRIFIDPDHCYYSDPCLLNASYTRFVAPDLAGLTGTGQNVAQQIISSDQYRGFTYPMPNFNLTCSQQLQNQYSGPLFCPPVVSHHTNPLSPLIVNYTGTYTITRSNTDIIYTFNISGTTTATGTIISPRTNGAVYYLCVGGGGAGGPNPVGGTESSGGGGGAGGFITNYPAGPAATLTANTSYAIQVGGGGGGGGVNGGNTFIDAFTAVGGGYGGYFGSSSLVGNGGSGGGSVANQINGGNGTAGQGNGGGSAAESEGSRNTCGGGGGGAGTAGVTSIWNYNLNSSGGQGGNGLSSSITGINKTYAGGGGAGCADLPQRIATGGTGGGGNGGSMIAFMQPGPATNGTDGLGGGGGGATDQTQTIIKGGSGVLVIRFPIPV